MKIVMLGAGYVGLVSGACFSEFGFNTVCIDKNVEKIQRLQNGELPIYEAGLDVLVKKNTSAGRLSFTSEIAQEIASAEVIFIAVGTPSRRGDGYADLRYVSEAVNEIATYIQKYVVIATKSTVPVGTVRRIKENIRRLRPDVPFDVCANPEFLRQGSAITDFMRPDRIIIGTDSEKVIKVMKTLYRPLYLLETPILFTTIETAEMIKYTANSFLATKITFINEIADLCEKVGANVQDVAQGIGLDKRIGQKFLHAGPGYGGSCFPKDTLALLQTAREHQTPLRIVETVTKVNLQRKSQMVQKIIAALGGSVTDLTLSLLGVTFKPNTDDIRESIALVIIPALQDAGATIHVYDPVGRINAQALLPNVVWFQSSYEAITGTNAMVILTEWNEFRALDLNHVKSLLKTPVVIDLRNIYTQTEMKDAGLSYHSIGRSDKS